MYFAKDWELLVPTDRLRSYSPDQVIFKQGRQVRHSHELDVYLDRVWEEETVKAKKVNNILTDGPLIRLDTMEIKENSLIFSVALTSYKEYKATCLPEYRARFEKEAGRRFNKWELASTFASATVPVTLDDYVVFLSRTNKVSEFKDYLSIPGGGRWDGDPIETYRAMLRSPQELFERCRNIVRNEFNGQVKTNKESHKLLSVYQSTEYIDNVLNFSVKLDNEAGELKEKVQKITSSSNKYKDIELVKFDEDKLTDYLNKNRNRIPSTILPAVVVAGAHKFGEDWPLRIKDVFIEY